MLFLSKASPPIDGRSFQENMATEKKKAQTGVKPVWAFLPDT